MGWRDMVANVQGTGKRTFREPYDFVPKSGVPVTGLLGIFREAHVETNLAGAELQAVSQQPMLDAQLTDLGAAPARGDVVTLTDRGISYEIEGSEEDGEGMAKLLLTEVPT